MAAAREGQGLGWCVGGRLGVPVSTAKGSRWRMSQPGGLGKEAGS